MPSTLTQQGIAHRVGATREIVDDVFRGPTHGRFLSKDKQRRVFIIDKLPKRW